MKIPICEDVVEFTFSLNKKIRILYFDSDFISYLKQ